MGAPVRAGSEAAPVLAAPEQALHTGAVFVQVGIVGNRVLAMAASRDAGADVPLRQSGPQLATV